jgi:hypothetical protein
MYSAWFILVTSKPILLQLHSISVGQFPCLSGETMWRCVVQTTVIESNRVELTRHVSILFRVIIIVSKRILLIVVHHSTEFSSYVAASMHVKPSRHRLFQPLTSVWRSITEWKPFSFASIPIYFNIYRILAHLKLHWSHNIFLFFNNTCNFCFNLNPNCAIFACGYYLIWFFIIIIINLSYFFPRAEATNDEESLIHVYMTHFK